MRCMVVRNKQNIQPAAARAKPLDTQSRHKIHNSL